VISPEQAIAIGHNLLFDGDGVGRTPCLTVESGQVPTGADSVRMIGAEQAFPVG